MSDYDNPNVTRDEIIKSAQGAARFDPTKVDVTDAKQAAFITNSIALRVLDALRVPLEIGDGEETRTNSIHGIIRDAVGKAVGDLATARVDLL